MKRLNRQYLLLLVGALLLAALMLPGAALAQDAGALVIFADQHVDGSVATVAQDIQVDGVVSGDVTSWSGTITIAGTVGGDVVSYGGAIRVLARGRVNGHIMASSGALQIDQGSSVAGKAIGESGGGGALASLLDLFMPASQAGEVGPFGRALFGIALGVLLLAFCFVCAALWPRRMRAAGVTLERLPGRALTLGLLTTFVVGMALLPLVGLLLASVIGLPLLLVLLALVSVPPIYGLAVLAQAGSARLMPRGRTAIGFDIVTIAIAAVLVLAIVVVAALAPSWGLVMFYLVASPGLGAAILSRGGTVVPLPAR